MLSRTVCGLAALCLALIAQSQLPVTVRGELLSQNPIGPNYFAELYSASSHTVAGSVMVNSTGDFEFHNIPAGHYDLRITNMYGQPLVSVRVEASAKTGHVEVPLPEARRFQPVSGTISARQLQHPVPKKAMQAMMAAQKFSESGDFGSAAEQLKRAIRIAPAYTEAHNNLGVQYIRLRQYEAAAVELEEALRAGPESSALDCNLAAALLSLGRHSEAERTVRRALALDARNLRADYLLGRILMLRPEGRPEALQHLLRAAPEIPAARIAASVIETAMQKR
ncbi:MAG: tetratricopeptide repeat protein [Acidobacteriota bacterium]|nr:tetratricopeptide repeat protein [Acidobacteriota bacterium]